MNTKRQTIWLVSMLGLMVVLSAYYLFTDDPGQGEIVSEASVDGAAENNQVVIEDLGLMDPAAAQEHIGLDDIPVVDESEEAEGTEAEGGADDAGDAAADSTSGSDAAAAGGDEAVLEQVANLSASDTITNMLIDRGVYFSKQLEELAAAMTDEAATDEEITAAIAKQNELMDLEEKLIAFEEKLFADYENAAVMYDDAKQHYTIHLSADHMEKSEAVSIVSEALSDLGISVHQVSIQLHH